jgi:hypothetical protein
MNSPEMAKALHKAVTTFNEGRRKKEEGSSATDSVTDVTDVTDVRKKEEGRVFLVQVPNC